MGLWKMMAKDLNEKTGMNSADDGGRAGKQLIHRIVITNPLQYGYELQGMAV